MMPTLALASKSLSSLSKRLTSESTQAGRRRLNADGQIHTGGLPRRYEVRGGRDSCPFSGGPRRLSGHRHVTRRDGDPGHAILEIVRWLSSHWTPRAVRSLAPRETSLPGASQREHLQTPPSR